jgi:hypothetical protein
MTKRDTLQTGSHVAAPAAPIVLPAQDRRCASSSPNWGGERRINQRELR